MRWSRDDDDDAISMSAAHRVTACCLLLLPPDLPLSRPVSSGDRGDAQAEGRAAAHVRHVALGPLLLHGHDHRAGARPPPSNSTSTLACPSLSASASAVRRSRPHASSRAWCGPRRRSPSPPPSSPTSGAASRHAPLPPRPPSPLPDLAQRAAHDTSRQTLSPRLPSTLRCNPAPRHPPPFIQAHESYCCSMAMSPDGGCMASGGFDAQVMLWKGAPPAQQ